jgi:OOP family OmpA-OmpF porin
LEICVTKPLVTLLFTVILSACAAPTMSPIDSDHDGVSDQDDRCPATVSTAQVDSYGCADSDHDGIIDVVDRCPNTPIDNDVDQFGCMDSDNDGVKNGEDQCPRTEAGERVMHNGCSARQAVSIESVLFEHGSAALDVAAHERLVKIAEVLRQTPQFRLAVQGHSDNSGSSDANYRLSRLRAKAVKAVLLEMGVSSARIDIQSYGDAMPIADNNTAEGRARNRRVALRVIRAGAVK